LRFIAAVTWLNRAFLAHISAIFLFCAVTSRDQPLAFGNELGSRHFAANVDDGSSAIQLSTKDGNGNMTTAAVLFFVYRAAMRAFRSSPKAG
jgi:hypothetical protein